MFKDAKDDNLGICGIKKGALFLSNSIEVLFEHLKAHLFEESCSQDVFAERILLTPSLGMQQWIQTTLATSLSIASGIIFTFLNKGVDILREKLFCMQNETFSPSWLELFLRLENEIDKAQADPHPQWDPVTSYVKDKFKRKIHLAKHLTYLFERYGVYGGQACSEWERNPKNWQQRLWANIFNEWDYPQRICTLLQEKAHYPANLSVHLFAFSHLSSLHFRFFCKVSKLVPVYFYQLSPCQEFWSDLHEYPLLGGLGKVGREMARLIEESSIEPEEAYLIFGGNTQLKKLQRSVLTLQEEVELADDPSIQLHISSTTHREIENLYHILYALFQNSEIEPKDIIVMAPEIDKYAPYIEAVFGRRIPFQIADLPIQKNIPLIEGLFLLLDLERQRWSVSAVLELFSHPLFRKKRSLSDEDLTTIKRWIQRTGVRWGLDGEHKSLLLKQGHCEHAPNDPSATWMGCFEHLIDELVLPPTDSNPPFNIEFSQAENLGNIIILLQDLYTDLRLLDSEKVINEWCALLITLAEKYFSASEDEEKFFLIMKKIQQGHKQFATKKYPFQLMRFLLQECMSIEYAMINRNVCQAVRFCSMLPMRAIPAKIICLLGMNHDAFPRKEECSSLNLLKTATKCDYSPSRLDFDRYLFLEAILSARERLIISYLGIDPFDLSEWPPSSSVTELIPWISSNQIFRHPVNSFEGINIEARGCFSIKINQNFILPQGDFTISIADLMRFSRSGLKHFLYFHNLKIEEGHALEIEEPFVLSPEKKGLLLKTALLRGSETAYKKAEKEGFFPSGIFRSLVEKQLKDEFSALHNKQLSVKHIVPFQFQASPSLRITFVGSMEGVFEKGIAVHDVFNLKSAAKIWPVFLVLNAIDPLKKELFFAGSAEVRTAFFEDPAPLLSAYMKLYFYAKENPFALVPEWIEPILLQDPKLLVQAPVYDFLLQWQLKGKSGINAEAIIEQCHGLIENIFGEMAHAWQQL